MAEANVTTNKQLPAEVLVNIFKHCGLSELVNVVDVCQLWRDVIIHQHMSVNDLVIRQREDINDLVSLLCKPVSFTKLHIVWDAPYGMDCSGVSLDTLANATSLNHLQSFNMLNFGDIIISNKVLDALLTLLQTSTETLTHFKLINTGYNLTWKVVELLEACQHLTHLVLNGCEMFDEDKQRCKDIIPTLTHLQLLDLRGTLLLENLSFIAAVKRGCQNISNNIMISWLSVKPSDDVSVLQLVSHVGTLYINGFNTEQLTALVSCLSERVSELSVDVLYVDRIRNHLTDYTLLSLVQRLRGLKRVEANDCQLLTNEGVVNVIKSSPRLEELNINDIKNIDKDIIQLLGRVVTEGDVQIVALFSKLSHEMRSSPDGKLYTGRNGKICLRWV